MIDTGTGPGRPPSRSRASPSFSPPRRRPPPTRPCASSSSAPTRTTATATPAARPPSGQAKGHQVKFVSVTNGDAGHQSEGGGALAKRRRAEAQEAARRFGIAEYEVLDNHDGELEPTLAVRQEIIRRIRRWNADVVIAPRPNDYHPDHRYTGVLVQDTAYMVMVPNVCPDTPPLRKNPVFLYSQDGFQRPNPFRPDVAVSIDSVFDQKIHGARRPRVAVLRVAPLGGGRPRLRAEGPRGAGRLAAEGVGREDDPREREGFPAEVVRGPGGRGAERRGLRGLRVRPAAHRGRAPPPLPVLRLRLVLRGGGPRTRRLRSILKRRERETPERRPALDARGLGELARPLAIVYTDTDDFTHRAARDGMLHFLMCFDRALRLLRPGFARHGGRLVKIEADSLMIVFPDASLACRGIDAMERALRRLNRALPTNEQLAFSYGIGFGQVLELEDDVFGLEVNLASKLGEDLARSGEVLLTPSAAEGLPASLRRRLAPYGQVAFAGHPMPVQRLRPRPTAR